jgi:hypothetical protein
VEVANRTFRKAEIIKEIDKLGKPDMPDKWEQISKQLLELGTMALDNKAQGF